jgi:hypothetical protein
VLKWFQEIGCTQFSWLASTLAVQNGHFEVVKWLRMNRYKMDPDSVKIAYRRDHDEIGDWLREN